MEAYLWGELSYWSVQTQWLVGGLLFCVLAMTRSRLAVWSTAAIAMAWVMGMEIPVFIGVSSVILGFNIPILRRYVLSIWILKALIKLKVLPTISATEQEAIDAGSVWADGELFSGSPNLKKLCSEKYVTHTQEEEEFLAGPVNQLCEMVDDWKVHQNRGFSPEIWKFIKENKFFGLIIPKEYGGLGFSAIAHSSIIQKFKILKNHSYFLSKKRNLILINFC